ncbi:hypothetical protein VSVS12_01129 [Vibrio scophthalmi]|uniref:DUF6765 family protein n=1 Tax=Vibrio scophthalmi TaxID=45658 RepID=UPI0008098E96|nr:DUF6765 family protein [Vibrio scophthalmi]ANS84896.1 hypothetical protein VSVS12_01129 [Vibrio scophthalmi]
MQIDMHYYGTYCLARAAGLSLEAARVIATSAQFVDDNAQENDIEFDDASACRVEPTAHHVADISNINPNDQRLVWVPFHFLPGNEGESFTEKLICRQDSEIAREMCANHLAQVNKPYFLPLIGIMAHVYADTFAHYGFSGVSSRKNRVNSESFDFKELSDEMHEYIVGKKDNFFDRFTPFVQNIKSQLAQDLSGALGHGGVVTFPDRPYLKWHFTYEDGSPSDWRDNVETFMRYCQKTHQMFSELANAHPQLADLDQQQTWQQLEPKVREIIEYQARGEDRILKWQSEAMHSELFNIAEAIPQYQDWNEGFESLSTGCSNEAMSHPIYGYYQAASYHRWYVLRELLPQHGLMVN